MTTSTANRVSAGKGWVRVEEELSLVGSAVVRGIIRGGLVGKMGIGGVVRGRSPTFIRRTASLAMALNIDRTSDVLILYMLKMHASK